MSGTVLYATRTSPLRRRRKFPYCDMDTGKATSTKTPTRHLQHGSGPLGSAGPARWEAHHPPDLLNPGRAGLACVRRAQAPTARVSPTRPRYPAGPARAQARMPTTRHGRLPPSHHVSGWRLTPGLIVEYRASSRPLITNHNMYTKYCN